MRTEPTLGEKVYYRTPEMGRKKKGFVIAGNIECGYEIKPVREGYVLNPPNLNGVFRDSIWTAQEHAAGRLPRGTGRLVAAKESKRRGQVGMDRIGMTEVEIMRHPGIVSVMEKILTGLAARNGYNPHFVLSDGVLHNDDLAANELFSEYVTAALGALRTSGNNASDSDIQQFKDYLAGATSESNIALTIARTGKTAAMRHLITNNDRLKVTVSYDTHGEDDHETGMRAIAAKVAVNPKRASGAVIQEALTLGIAEQLEALDDTAAAVIIKMKFGLEQFEHAYKEQDIAAALNRAKVPAPNGLWDAVKVKIKMLAALAILAHTRGMRNLRDFVCGGDYLFAGGAA
jgi:hypothetical protein